jgi:hypothetical protein
MKDRVLPPHEWIVLTLPCLLACGCSSAARPAGDVPDAAGVADGGSEGPAGDDAGSTAFLDAAPPQSGMLQAGDSLSVRQVTSDGFVVYSDDAAGELYAVPLAGGNAQHIASLGSTFWITGQGPVVFVWSGVNATNVGALSVWSSAKGGHSVSSASLSLVATASADGSQVLYLDHVDPAGQTGDVYVAASDGTGAAKLLGSQQLTGCAPQLGFAGSYAIASHCDVPRGPGPSSTISSFCSPAWTRSDLATEAANIWSADSAASVVLLSTGSGVQVAPIGGGPLAMIDTSGFLGQLMDGGKTAIYSTTSHALRRSPITAPSPMTLVPTFGGFYGLSPDETSVLFFEDFGPTGAGVYLAPAVAPSTPVALWTAQTGGVNGDSFTADSNYALYSTGIDPQSQAGTLNAVPVAGGTPRLLGASAWSDLSATGAKVVFVDHYVATGGLRFGRGDIESVDLSTGTEPTTIVSGADAVMALSPAGDFIVYSWSAQAGPNAGIFVTRVP